MCGILCLWNNNRDLSKALETLQVRGIDFTGYWNGTEIVSTLPSTPTVFIHCLHAIVENIPQPFTGKGALVVNGEIYNWKELSKQHNLSTRNDSEVLFQLLEQVDDIHNHNSIQEVLDTLDGVYAAVYQRDEKIIFFRDMIGVKPLWFSTEQTLAVASEKKVLHKADFKVCEEVKPQDIYYYNTTTNELKSTQREFFTATELSNKNEEELINKAKELLVQAVQKRIPDNKIKVGVLLSGGVDSTLLAKICQDLGMETICYTAVMDDGENKEAHDLTASIEVSQTYNFKHKIIKITQEQLKELAKESVELIEEADAVKVAVAIPFLAATKKAREDGCRILFSGLGAEELFAGYKRHKDATDINAECIAGLTAMHTRDLYRDDVITMRNGLELRLPFLDRNLISFSLALPAELKINNGIEKYILRKAAVLAGLQQDHAFRPKKAAQYGSKVDKILKKIANKENKTRKEYLEQFL